MYIKSLLTHEEDERPYLIKVVEMLFKVKPKTHRADCSHEIAPEPFPYVPYEVKAV